MSNENNKLIRNSTAEFLMFTVQSREQSIEARYEDESVWLSQKLMATLFEVDVRTISEHLSNIYSLEEITKKATIRKFRIVQDRLFESDFDRMLKELEQKDEVNG